MPSLTTTTKIFIVNKKSYLDLILDIFFDMCAENAAGSPAQSRLTIRYCLARKSDAVCGRLLFILFNEMLSASI